METIITKVLLAVLGYISTKYPALLDVYIEDRVALELSKRLNTISSSVYKGLFK